MLRLEKFIILFSLIIILPGWLWAQNFDVPITVTDGINTQILTIGADPNGTDGFDLGLDQPAPPMPPAGAFGTLLVWKSEQYFTDIRESSLVEKTFVIRYQSQTGGAIVLSWDNASLSSLGSFLIVDDITGTLFSLDMTSTNSLEISSSKFITDKLRILVNTESTGINDVENNITKSYFLSQNYPNPFNPSTVISWYLPVSSDVEVGIYNLLGQKVATLVSEKLPAGYHEVEFDGQTLSSGVYLYKIEAGRWQDVKKMSVIK